jgi:hypothetical protein
MTIANASSKIALDHHYWDMEEMNMEEMNMEEMNVAKVTKYQRHRQLAQVCQKQL